METLKLCEPAFLNLQSPDGTKTAQIDIYVARKFLVDAERQPTEEAHWGKVLNYLADQLQVDVNQLARNQAIRFHNAIMVMCEEKNKELSDKSFLTASSDVSTQVSQEAIENGQSN
jgi:hypothetical protein